MFSALVWPYGWDIFSLSLANWLQLSPMDSCQAELSPSDPIESVCQHLQPFRSCKSFTSGIIDHTPCAHFRFRWRSDSIACEWRRSDSGRVYWTCVVSGASFCPLNKIFFAKTACQTRKILAALCPIFKSPHYVPQYVPTFSESSVFSSIAKRCLVFCARILCGTIELV